MSDPLSLDENLFMLRGVIGDLRHSFSRAVDPERWVADTQAFIDRIREQVPTYSVDKVTALERQFHLAARDWQWKAAQNNNQSARQFHEMAVARAETWDLAARCVACLLTGNENDAQTSSALTRTNESGRKGVTLPVGEKPALRDRVYEAAFYSGKPGDPFPELLEEYVRASHDECKADLDESQMQLAQAEVTIERLRRVLADTHNNLTMILAHAKEACDRLNAVEFRDDPKPAFPDETISEAVERIARAEAAIYADAEPMSFGDGCRTAYLNIVAQITSRKPSNECRHHVSYRDHCPDCEAMK